MSTEEEGPNPIGLVSVLHQRKGHVKTEKVIIPKPRREVSAGTNPTSPLILDFQNREIKHFCGLNHPVCGILPRQPKHTNITGYSQTAIAKRQKIKRQVELHPFLDPAGGL